MENNFGAAMERLRKYILLQDHSVEFLLLGKKLMLFYGVFVTYKSH